MKLLKLSLICYSCINVISVISVIWKGYTQYRQSPSIYIYQRHPTTAPQRGTALSLLVSESCSIRFAICFTACNPFSIYKILLVCCSWTRSFSFSDFNCFWCKLPYAGFKIINIVGNCFFLLRLLFAHWMRNGLNSKRIVFAFLAAVRL